MTPIEKVLSRLPGHRTAGDGFKACCPSHEDRNPSLSIKEASDGTVLMKCFSGCPTPRIVSDLELDMADLFPTPREPSWPKNTSPKSHSEPRNFASADDAIKAYGRGSPDRQWSYTNADDVEVGRTTRWQTAAGKEIRPVAKFPDGWRHAAMPEPRPLFNLQNLTADCDSVVYVVEGEKCVDALTALGLLATTSAGGSQAARLTDWTPLTGRRVVALGRRQSHLRLERRPKYSSLPGHHPAPERVPPTREAPPYQGARNPGSTSERLVSRDAYGAPIGRFSHLQQALGQHTTELRMAKALAREAAAMLDQGEGKAADGIINGLKAEGVEIALAAVDASMRAFGAEGYSDQVDLGDRLQDLQGLRIADGTTDVMRMSVVARSFGKTGERLWKMAVKGEK